MKARLDPGDVLAIYSDGVTEANDVDQQEFGEERLIEVLRQHRGESAESILKAVNDAVAAFAAGAPQADDITLVVAKKE